MGLKRLEAQGHIEKAKFSVGQIESNLNRAQRDLRTAKANLKIDEEWAYTIAYHAMLRAGRAFIFACGYRPRGKDQHKTVVEFCSETFGKRFSTSHYPVQPDEVETSRFYLRSGAPDPQNRGGEVAREC
jgi:uncharacterized protein (UPF0332 family)